MSLSGALGATCQQPIVLSIKFNATDLKVETDVQMAHQNDLERDLPPAHTYVPRKDIYYSFHLMLSLFMSHVLQGKRTNNIKQLVSLKCSTVPYFIHRFGC